MPFTKSPHGRYCPASAHLDHYQTLAAFEPGCELLFLPFRMLLHPLRVSEHKNVRPSETSAMWTPRHFVLEQTCRFVDDRHEVVSRPRLIDASLDALKPVDGAVAFHNVLFIESCLLELTVDVAGERESAVLHCRRPPEQNVEARMRHGRAIEREAVTIESPAQARIARKARGVGDVLERKSIVAQCRVCTPEPFRSTEVG